MAIDSVVFAWICFLMVFPVVTPDTISISLNHTNGMFEFQEYFGCGGMASKMASNTIVEIEGGQNLTLFEGPMFCLVSNLNNVTIRSSTSEQVTLRCPGSLPCSQTGFGFYNMSNLSLENIRIDNCGSVVDKLLLEDRPGVSAFGTNRQAVITISMSTNVHLLNIDITNYLGYAIISHTVLGEYRIDGLHVRNSYAFNELSHERFLKDNSLMLSGSGLILRYIDTNIDKGNANTTVVISNVEIASNRNLLPLRSLSTLEKIRLLSRRTGYLQVPYGGNGMIYVVFSNTEYDIDFTLQRANIADNFGTIGGGITVAHVDSNLRSKVTFEDCHISNNLNGFISGAGIQLYYVFTNRFVLDHSTRPTPEVHNTFVLNSVIQNNTSPLNGGGFSTVTESQDIADIALRFTNTTFIQNKARYGDGLYFQKDYSSFIQTKEFSVYLDTVKMIDNGYYRPGKDPKSSCIYVTGLTKLVISGSEENKATFSGHNTSVVRAINSHVYLKGSVTFMNNQGQRGGALSLSDNSHLIFIHQSRVIFSNNSAQEYGGAVYIDSVNGLQCEIQFLPPTFSVDEVNKIVLEPNNLSTLDYSIVFSNNHARTGNSVFGTQIYNCQPYPEAIVQLLQRDIAKVYQSLFTFRGSSFKDEVRSKPYRVCHCHVDMNATCLDFDDDDFYLENLTYPGLKYVVSVMVVDIIGQPVNANLYAEPLDSSDVILADNFQRTLQLEAICSPVAYSFLASENTSIKVRLRTDSYGEDTSLTLGIFIQECPLGFAIIDNTCTCSKIYRITWRTCNISTGLIQRRNNEWLGTAMFGEQLVPAYFRDCPSGYCDTNLSVVNLSMLHPVCAENREGVVCGRCKEGFSNVFGSVACKECSSFWILTVFIYMIIGIILVMVIDKLDLTVTNGTINGIIFYAQMTAITTNIFSMERGIDYAASLVRFINLEIGIPIPVCFYDGMTTLSEYVLQVVFPLYLGFIVIFTVCLAKCYSIEKKINISNSVNIFVTLIYLSYGKVLTTILFLLTPLALNIEEGKDIVTQRVVWYYDGMQGYFGGVHLIIGLIAVLIFLVFIIPYQFLILFSQWCLKFRFLAYYLPIVDANVAPFKDKYRFWFGMRLIITGLLIIESAFLSIYFPLLIFLVNTVVLSCLLVIQAYVQPYKSAALNKLDLSFLLNLTLLYVTRLYVQYGANNENKLVFYLVYERFSSVLALLTFTGIIIYHIVKAVKKSTCYKRLKEKSYPTVELDETREEEGIRLRSLQRSVIETRFISSLYNRYRESALDLV